LKRRSPLDIILKGQHYYDQQYQPQNCHNETPCIAIVNQKKFFFPKNRGQECKTGPVWGLLLVGRGKDIRKGCRRVNMVEAEYFVLIYINEKNETC
jgi:hypothetical protein